MQKCSPLRLRPNAGRCRGSDEAGRPFGVEESISVDDALPEVALHGVYKVIMRRIGFRRLLPLIFTAMHLILLLDAAAHPVRASANAPATLRAVAYQEERTEIDWKPMEPRPLNPAQRLAMVINLPALLLGIPIAATMFTGSDMALLYAASPFVPLLWYGIGRWLDIKLGFLPHSSHRLVLRLLRGGLALVAGVFLLAAVVALSRTSHHRTEDTYWIGSALILWSSLFFTMGIPPFSNRRAGVSS